MAIVLTDPQKDVLAQAKSVLVYSNAVNVDEAIREIDSWARENGFVRVAERWLGRVRRPDIGDCFKGVCRKVMEEDFEGERIYLDQIRKRRESMPLTPDSATLTRD